MRYEDLLIDPIRVLTELFKFMLDVPNIEGTILESQIAKHGSQKSSTKAIYGLKSNNTELCRSKHMYTEEQIKHIKTELKDYLHFYGYAKDPSDPDQKTGFFSYDDDETSSGPTSAPTLPLNGFLAHNERALAAVGKPREVKEYFYNTPEELYNLFPGFTLLSLRSATEQLHVDI